MPPCSAASRARLRRAERTARSCAARTGALNAGVKKPPREIRDRMCTRKRRYRTPGDALDAALLAGVERRRSAYRCQVCGHWHLTTSG